MSASFLTVGLLLLVGLALDALGRRMSVPRVTLLLLLGFVAGPGALDVLPSETEQWFPIIAVISLAMIGFLLGAEFTTDQIKDHGAAVALIVLVQAAATALVVAVGLLALGARIEVALSLAAIATATAPAATVAVVHELDASGPLSRTLLATVALDDILAVSLFGVLASVAGALTGAGAGSELAVDAAIEIFGGIGLGVVLGLPMAYATGRIRAGEPTREEAIGGVLVCAGLALWLDVSFLLASVAMGTVVANLARHHERPFQELERIEWPFLTMFFVLAGASLEFGELQNVGWIGVGYIVLRGTGKLLGGSSGMRLAGLDRRLGPKLGVSLLPQAGVAIGLSLLAADRFPDVADEIIAVVVAGTVVFELVGPILTRRALTAAGEAGTNPVSEDE